MKTPDERGPVGWWAYQERDNRDWSVAEVLTRLAAEGVHIGDSTIRGIESGHKKASARVIRGLEQVYGSPSPDTKKQAAEPLQLDSLIAALDRQTEAISLLVAALAPDQEPTIPLSAVREVVRQIVSSAPDLAALVQGQDEPHVRVENGATATE